MSKKTKHWILTLLNLVATILNVMCFLGAGSAYGYVASPPETTPYLANKLSILLFLIVVTGVLNIVLIWSPIREVRELSNYFSLKLRRKALEEQRKIDELEIIELKHHE